MALVVVVRQCKLRLTRTKKLLPAGIQQLSQIHQDHHHENAAAASAVAVTVADCYHWQTTARSRSVFHRPIISGSKKSLRPFSTFQTTEREQRSATTSTTGRIESFLRNQIQIGQLQKDSEQLNVARRLDELLQQIIQTDSNVVPASKLEVDWFFDHPPKNIMETIQIFWENSYRNLSLLQTFTTISSSGTPQGMYIFGSVGVGKSFLMDLFYEQLRQQLLLSDNANQHHHHHQQQQQQQRKIRRCHFNEFMLDIHQRIHDLKQVHPKQDVLPFVALSLARESRILCLDEFQVTDIADAAILKRLFSMLWMETRRVSAGGGGMGMVVVATSNRDPDALYEGGLNRTLFLPFIDVLKRHMTIIEMGGDKDYRREERPCLSTDLNHVQCYHWPMNTETSQALDQIFATGVGTVKINTRIPVRMGRHVTVPRSNDTCAWFDFEDLCHRPLGAADYLAICERYPVLIINRVPQLNASLFNEARRFVTLIDAVYESKTRLVLAANVPLKDLLVDFEATVATHDGDEEIAGEAIQSKPVNKKNKTEGGDPAENIEEGIFVKGEGGSSSSAATTMVQTKEGEVEWSATGRIGVSLAQLSAVKEVSFSFQRAESRLFEMSNHGTRI